MKRVFEFAAVVTLVFAGAGSAVAAEITNNDAAAHTLRITENGERSEVVIDPNQTLVLCVDGCFMTAPNGDLLAVEGDETISLVEGAAVVQ